MGAGSYIEDEFGDGSDDYSTQYDVQGNAHAVVGWRGYDPNAAGAATAADQTVTAGASGADRQALLNQAAGINQTAGGINNSATRIGQSAQVMSGTANSITGLSDQLGAAPSAAVAAARSAEQVGNAQAMSQAASARGANSALMMREAASNNDARDRQIASDTATASANELNNRYATRAGMLGTAAGVQNNVTGAYGAQAGALGTAASAQNAAGGLISGSRTGDIAQRGQDVTATQGANQLQQTHDDAMYAGLAAKHNKADSDAGGSLDSAFSMLSDMKMKTDVEPLPSYALLPTTPESAKSADSDKGSGTSSMISGLLAAYGGSGGGAMMMSDERSKAGRKKLDEQGTDSQLTALLRQATRDDSKRLDTGDVRRDYDRGALDDAQRASGSRVFGASAPSQVPTARFADYQPPTARFADTPMAAPARPAAPPAYDVAALDDAYRREGSTAPSYLMSDRETKTDRQKLLDMAMKPDSNRENLDKVDGYTYRYKPEAAERIGEDTSTRPGVMAQDLEKAPAGKAVIEETPLGKGLDIKRALGFSLAGVAGLDKRLQRLEAASGGRRKSAA